MIMSWSRRLPRMRSLRHARRCLLNTKTYYDSQSGMHIPLHNEDEISVFAELTGWFLERNALDDKEDLSAELELIQKAGFSGAALLPQADEVLPKTTGDVLLASASAMSDDFTIFVPSRDMADLPSPDNINLMFEYAKDDIGLLESRLSTSVEEGMRTTVALVDPSYYEDDPIVVASDIAGLIDSTRGGNVLWLAPEEVGAGDSIVALCEELSYLDVAGPTTKSRLVVDLHACSYDDETLVELLTMGVNKFAFIMSDDENQEHWNWLESIVKEEGKRLVRDS